ncbi:MAG: DUF2181 domain-containing protein [Candidatus Riflebacteria bacterium]|nr:DUF2181 domain-containing protein [Candidatus Riflebacteria bacterium]
MKRTVPHRASRALALLFGLLLCRQAGAQGLELLDVRQDGSDRLAVAAAPAADPEIERLVELARRTRGSKTEWTPGKPLAEGRNAHNTNTKEHMKEALERAWNFIEGDVRQELNPPHELEMRHDACHETGDNLTLRQWLAVGAASGRGLKLDVKEPQHVDRVIEEVVAAGVPEGRLMSNLGFDAMETWGSKIRARFPGVRLAINPPSGAGKLDASRVDAMLAQGRRFGGPVTFVVRFDLLTAASLHALKTGGPVSVWNSPFEGPTVEDAAAVTRSLKERGVDGVVDIRQSKSLGDRVAGGIDRVKNQVRTNGEGLIRKVVGSIPGL